MVGDGEWVSEEVGEGSNGMSHRVITGAAVSLWGFVGPTVLWYWDVDIAIGLKLA